jgi:hypothetical protein
MTMSKAIAALAAMGALISLAAFAAATPAKKMPLRSTAVVSISLPGDLGFAFKPAPGANLANSLCLSCHSEAYVAMQPPFSKTVWTAEIVKMRNVYGAKISDDQVAPLADYLTTNYGTP